MKHQNLAGTVRSSVPGIMYIYIIIYIYPWNTKLVMNINRRNQDSILP